MNVCMCVFICRDSFEIKGLGPISFFLNVFFVCLYTTVSASLPERESIIICHWGHLFFLFFF